jgi:hypothetical protein
MPYGTIKVDNITFDNGGTDKLITVSGLFFSTSGALTVTGTISGGNVTAPTATFTTLTGTTTAGTTATFTSGSFTSLTGVTTTVTSGVFSSGIATAPSVAIGSGTTYKPGIYSPGADQVAISTNGTQRATIDSSGRLLVGTSSARSNLTFGGVGISPLYQVESTGAESSISITRNATNNLSNARLVFAKNNSATLGTNVLVDSGEVLGEIAFNGNDGTNFIVGANITGEVDGTPGSNDMPGRLVFSTTADGAASPTERLRITSAGLVGLGTSSPSERLSVAGNICIPYTTSGSISAGDPVISQLAANTAVGTVTTNTAGQTFAFTTYFDASQIALRAGTSNQSGIQIGGSSSTLGTAIQFATNSAERMRIDSSGRVGIGTTSPADVLHVNNGNIRVTNTNSAIGLYGANGSSPQVIFGNAAGTNHYLIYETTDGSGNRGSLTFYDAVATTIRAVIDSSGRLGIGTSSPTNTAGFSQQLQLTGNLPCISIDNTGTGANKYSLGVNSVGALGFWDNTASAFRMYITSSGNVGIGTTSPGSLLDLRSASAPSLHISDTGFTPDYRGYSIDLSRAQQTGGINFTTSSPSAFLDLYAGGSASSLGGWDGQIRFFTGGTNAYGTERGRIDSSGRLLVGTSTSTNNIRLDQKLAVVSTNGNYGGISVSSYVGTTAGIYPIVDLQRSRGTTDGSMTVVANNDTLGSYTFRGSDGTNFINAAVIFGEVDGTPGANDMPGRLVFSTTADGAASPTERMRIDNAGNIAIGASSTSGARLFVTGGALTSSASGGLAISAGLSAGRLTSDSSNINSIHTYLDNSTIEIAPGSTFKNGISINGNSTSADTNTIKFFTGNGERMRINSTGSVTLLGATSVASGTHSFQDNGSSPNTVRLYNTTDSNNAGNRFLICDAAASVLRAEIRSNGGLANYSANNANLSDRNAKKDISLAADTWSCVKEWEIVNYRYKDQPDDADLNLGVIAQQVAKSCPEVITVFQEAKEATETDPAQEERLGIKEQQMYWMAIKALQEAMERIESLEVDVAALKGP